MICDFPKWWIFLKYDGYKSQLNITEVIIFCRREINIGKQEAGPRYFYQAYDKFQAKSNKAQTRQLLDMAPQMVLVRFTQWKIIMLYLETSKTFLPKSVYITLLLSKFIRITVCLFLNGSRRQCHMLIQMRHNIFGTTRGPIIVLCCICGKR